MAEHVAVEQQGDLAVVRIDRPPANAMDLELLAEGHEVLAELASAEPGAVVVTGREGFFSAGLDLKLVPTLDADGLRSIVAGINRLFAGWYGLMRPVVSAVNGHAIAGGLILALCGDHRVAATEGRYGLTELKTGNPFPAVAMGVVKEELSPAAARLLVLGSGLHGAAKMLELGVFDELAAPDAVLPRALEVAEELASMPSSAYALVKGQLRGESLHAMNEVVAGRADPMARAWPGEESAGAAAGVVGG